MILRDYQTEAIAAIEAAWSAGVRSPAVVLPTGSGKTVIFSEMVRRASDKRLLILAHRQELISQTMEKLCAIGVPRYDIGIVRSQNDQCRSRIIIAGTQTLMSEYRRRRIGAVDRIIVDECHHYSAPKWREVIEHFDAFRVGFTATMSREDKLKLGDIWNKVVYSKDIYWMIEHGHLVPPHGITIDVEGLRLSAPAGADYTDRAISAAMRSSKAVETVVKTWHNECSGKSTILFAPSIEMAVEFADGFEKSGIKTGVITGSTKDDERRSIYRKFDSGEITVLSSCMVLTEGFDSPTATVAIIARPTKSRALYIQMVGRVLRLHPGKSSALVIDIAGAGDGKSLTLEAVIPTPQEPGMPTGPQGPRGAGDPASPIDLDNATFRRVDFMSDRPSVWKKTHDGELFISTGKNFVFIVADPNGYTVGRTFSDRSMWGRIDGKRIAPERFASGIPLDFAVSMAEEIASASGVLSQRLTPWRGRTPSDRQRAFAASMGVQIVPGMTAGDVSDAIDIIKASAIIDKKARKRE